ncbi:hypothetical protein BDZ91DRAFT_358465 [Kalaharituber pfeilii]|nr:hypothetical protein BDZ91DRAFT_358465 [Kalaharituber pfeilii]
MTWISSLALRILQLVDESTTYYHRPSSSGSHLSRPSVSLPLQRLGRGVTKIAGLLGNKGLKAWRYRIGEAPDPDCR